MTTSDVSCHMCGASLMFTDPDQFDGTRFNCTTCGTSFGVAHQLRET